MNPQSAEVTSSALYNSGVSTRGIGNKIFTCFHNQDFNRGIFCQSGGHDKAGRPTSNDDEVVRSHDSAHDEEDEKGEKGVYDEAWKRWTVET